MLLMAISGSLLLYKNELLMLLYPQLALAEPVSVSAAGTIADGFSSGYALMPTADRPWFEVVDAEKTHYYYDANGTLLLERHYLGDTMSWLVELHHHLALNELGKDILGILGLLSIALITTGIVRWWPRRGSFSRALSVRWFNPFSKRGMQTLWQLHRFIGVTLFVPIVIVIITGTAIMYAAPVKSVLVSLFPQTQQHSLPPLPDKQASNWSQRLALVEQALPTAEARLLYLEEPQIRAKHQTEWHPNGRNYLQFTPSGTVAKVIDERSTALGNRVSNMIYPTHVAAIGGSLYLAVILLSGLALIVLPISGVWFYVKRRGQRLK
ncbi:PepSY domain-containing protein [Idiomarina sp. OT37-5b]|nr:PepSY domain-containing protein [Idiomarina sp. OT37-5b]